MKASKFFLNKWKHCFEHFYYNWPGICSDSFQVIVWKSDLVSVSQWKVNCTTLHNIQHPFQREIIWLHFFCISNKWALHHNQHPIIWVLPRSSSPGRSVFWSDHIRAQTWSRCARITWSGKSFERTFAWTLIWPLSRTVWSEANSSANWSDQRRFWTRFSLIRDFFEGTLIWPEEGFRVHLSFMRVC